MLPGALHPLVMPLLRAVGCGWADTMRPLCKVSTPCGQVDAALIGTPLSVLFSAQCWAFCCLPTGVTHSAET